MFMEEYDGDGSQTASGLQSMQRTRIQDMALCSHQSLREFFYKLPHAFPCLVMHLLAIACHAQLGFIQG